ncbi:VanZ family protein [Arenibacter palladensis]|nr:VanZ family protein [Arenibacter palladensis]
MIKELFINKVKLLGLLLFVLGVFIIFYLSWKSNPNVGELSFVPDWLADWTDKERNSRRRTAVPFIGLGILLGAYLSYKKRISLGSWFFVWIVLGIIVSVAEMGQYFLPSRSPDMKDVIWGVVGSSVGLGTTFLISLFIRTIKNRF